MSEDFDPYAQWLDIAPHEHPVDHYRLLGVAQFERDPDVIAHAADERMAHIRTFQTGPRASHTQALLNELATARVCLLHPEAKTAYDQMLEGALQAASTPPTLSQPTHSDLPSEDPPPRPAPLPIRTDYAATAWSPSELAWLSVLGLVLAASVVIGLLIARYWFGYEFSSGGGEQVAIEVTEEVVETPPVVTREPVLIYQEADGGVNFSADVAQLHGPSLRHALMNDVDVITDWKSLDDWASWNFKIARPPPQGVFQVHISYAAQTESDGGSFVIAVGDAEKVCEIRGTGEPVTDSYFLAVPRAGEHTLTIRAKDKPAARLMTLRSVTFAVP